MKQADSPRVDADSCADFAALRETISIGKRKARDQVVSFRKNVGAETLRGIRKQHAEVVAAITDRCGRFTTWQQSKIKQLKNRANACAASLERITKQQQVLRRDMDSFANDRRQKKRKLAQGLALLVQQYNTSAKEQMAAAEERVQKFQRNQRVKRRELLHSIMALMESEI